MRKMAIIIVATAPMLLGGCLAKTAVGIATAPVKVVSQAVDWTTTSRDEADRNYGRKARKADAREGRKRREADKRCRRDPENCEPYSRY